MWSIYSSQLIIPIYKVTSLDGLWKVQNTTNILQASIVYLLIGIVRLCKITLWPFLIKIDTNEKIWWKWIPLKFDALWDLKFSFPNKSFLQFDFFIWQTLQKVFTNWIIPLKRGHSGLLWCIFDLSVLDNIT